MMEDDGPIDGTIEVSVSLPGDSKEESQILAENCYLSYVAQMGRFYPEIETTYFDQDLSIRKDSN